MFQEKSLLYYRMPSKNYLVRPHDNEVGLHDNDVRPHDNEVGPHDNIV